MPESGLRLHSQFPRFVSIIQSVYVLHEGGGCSRNRKMDSNYSPTVGDADQPREDLAGKTSERTQLLAGSRQSRRRSVTIPHWLNVNVNLHLPNKQKSGFRRMFVNAWRVDVVLSGLTLLYFCEYQLSRIYFDRLFACELLIKEFFFVW